MSNNSDNNNKFSRRQALNLGAVGLVTAQAGLNLGNLAGSFLPKTGIFGKLERILATCDTKALAQAAAEPLVPPLVTWAFADKKVEQLVFAVDDAGIPNITNLTARDKTASDRALEGFQPRFLPDLFAPGKPLNELISFAGQTSWRNLQLTRMAAEILSGMPNNVSVAMVTAGQKNGNHTYQNSDLSPSLGSAAYQFQIGMRNEDKNTGIMGFIGFDMNSGATGSSAAGFTGPNGSAMPLFRSVADIRNTLRNSVAALNAEGSFLSYRKSLDQLVIKDDKSLENLQKIREKSNAALVGLKKAMEADNFVDQQLQTMFALYDAGLSANFGLVIPTNDMNANQAIISRGGDHNISTVEAMAYYLYAMTEIAKRYPNSRQQDFHDGTRASDGNDRSSTFHIHVGPSNVFNSGVFGPVPGANGNFADLGSNRNGNYAMSNGMTMTRAGFPNLHVTTLASYGIDVSSLGIPYLKGLLK